MVKDKIISLKIRSEQYNNCKDFGVKLIECFDVGYEKILENYKEKLAEIVEKRHKEYIRVYTKLKDFEQNNKEILTKLDENCYDYIKSRPIENPDQKDRFWIKSKIEKYKLGVSVDKFLNRCKELQGLIN